MAALEAQEAAATSSGSTTVMEPPPTSSSSSSSSLDSAGQRAPRASPPRPSVVRDEHGVVGMQLMMVSSAFALSGHYDEELMDLIGRQVRGGTMHGSDRGSLVGEVAWSLGLRLVMVLCER